MPELNAKIEKLALEGGREVTVLSLVGFIDSSTYISFENVLEMLLRERRDVIIDMSDLTYINSSGMSALLNYYRTFLDTGKEFVLAEVSREVETPMQLLGLTAIVPFFADREEAVKYLLSAPAGSRTWTPFARPAEVPALAGVQAPAPAATAAAGTSVLMVVPRKDHFVEVTRLRFEMEKGRCRVLHNCVEALSRFDEVNPDLIILEDRLEQSEEFLWKVKAQKRRSVVPVVKLYWSGTDINARKDFKIWENDYLVEPFEMMELFLLGETELRRRPEEQRRLLHHTHFEFRTTGPNIDRGLDLVRTLSLEACFTGERFAELNAAFAEAVDNAMRHGNRGNPDRYIDVTYQMDNEKVTITVEDEGDGFDFEWHLERARRIAAGESPPPSSEGRIGGLGIPLMYKSTDRIMYFGRGNIVRLEKKLASG